MVKEDSRWKIARKRPGIVEYREVKGPSEMVNTGHGLVVALRETDYIMKDTEGYEYPIRKTIFRETYEVIKEPEQFCYWQIACADDYKDDIRISWTCSAHLHESRANECPYSSLEEAKNKRCVDAKPPVKENA